MGINLSDATPAALSGSTNVRWQKDSSGNVSASVPVPLTSGTANEVLATPNGSTGDVVLRALVAADIPALAESKITNLTTDLAAKVPATRTISTTAPLTGGGDLSADRTLAISNFTGDSGSGGAKGAVPAPSSGDGTNKFLKADGTWAIPAGATSGTVTSVGLTVPSFLSVSGSPVTSTGTLAVSLSGTALPVANGGTGTTTPAIVAGTGITVTGTWPNQTVAATSGTTPLVIGFSMGSGATGTGLAYAVAPRSGTVSKCKLVVKASDGTTDLTFKIKQNGVNVFSSDPTVTHGASAGSLTTSTSLTSSPLTVVADDIFSIDITSGTSSWVFSAQLES